MKRKKKYNKNRPPKHTVEQYSEGLRQKIMDKNIPTEAIFKDTYMTIIGHSEVWVENYKALLEYKEEQIVLQAGNYLIELTGEKLTISHYMEEHMMICGSIRNITYL